MEFGVQVNVYRTDWTTIKRYIEALETNRFEVLPAEVFTKGFLRQYAVYVGLDPEEVVNYYLAALRAQKDREEPDSDLRPRPRTSLSSNLGWLFLAALVAAGLIALVWLLFKMSAEKEGAVGQEPDSVGSRISAAVEGLTGSAKAGSADQEAGSEEQGAVSKDESARPSALGQASTLEPTTSVAEQESPQTPRAALTDSSSVVVPTDGSLVLVADFSGDCWVEATTDDSNRLAEMRVQGESLRLEAQSSIDLKLGNALVVQVQVNGMALPLKPSPGSSVVARRIDAQTVAQLRRSAAVQ